MPDYKNGKIYKIVCYETDEIYVGSTVRDIEDRLYEHKKSSNVCCSKQIIDRNNYYIELLETYPCNNEFELKLKEGEYQKSMKCINKLIAGRTEAEYRQDNKEKISKNNREYRQNNLETVRAHDKERYQDNKETINARHREWRQNNKEAIKAHKSKVVICECGIKSAKGTLAQHRRSKKHIDLMNKLNLS
tara:strand:- start:15 stop:584 length:570 start_codon:yes stop_codon:yes gene_type:complete